MFMPGGSRSITTITGKSIELFLAPALHAQKRRSMPGPVCLAGGQSCWRRARRVATWAPDQQQGPRDFLLVRKRVRGHALPTQAGVQGREPRSEVRQEVVVTDAWPAWAKLTTSKLVPRCKEFNTREPGLAAGAFICGGSRIRLSISVHS